ncbi:MAG: hypothetical protein KGY74_05340 [Candidatus Cloacimonetes bacterium]|nr:hypothetical protein [Candidatus Cloacimonadota bacterium]
MPWKIEDVDKHKKGLALDQKKKWIRIANNVREKCIIDGGSEKECDAKAIRIANSEFQEEKMKDKKFEIITDISEATVDVDKNTIKNVVILSEKSKNGRIYTKECQASAVANGKFEGMQSFFNHSKDGSRDVRDLIGKYVNVKFDEQSSKTVGDLRLIPDTQETKKMLSIAEEMPDLLGNSISARGKYYREDDMDVVTEIVDAYSGDIVSRPATTKGLFEDEENNNNRKKETEMEIKDLTVELIREQKPSILQPIDSKIEKLEKENKDLKEEKDKLETKLKMIEKKEDINEKIKEAELPQELVTDIFLESLMSADKEKIDKLIEDRKNLLEIGGGVEGNHERNEGEAIQEEEVLECFEEEGV